MYKKVKSSHLSSDWALHNELTALHMGKNSMESDSDRTSFVIITVSKKHKRTYSDVWDNLNHSSAAAALKLLTSATNISGGTRARIPI